MNPFNAWPDRIWIGKLCFCSVCHNGPVKCAMLIGLPEHGRVDPYCSYCARKVVAWARMGAEAMADVPAE